MTHVHHKIARSRGGTDDEWNLVEMDPYTHAYEHALDFVLFEHAPRFDFRHEAWGLLPTDLRKAVLKETAIRTKKLNETRLVTGEHNLLHMDKKPWVSSLLTNLAKLGKHPMQKESNILNLKERNRQDLLNGKHTCQQPGHQDRMNKLNNTPTECPHCGKMFKSPGGAGNHIRLKHEKY